jgi:16S rRNA (cytidine1402-2'-O)-methyltransferase
MLTLVATPIGNLGDLTLRAIEVLKAADLIGGEEKKETDLLRRRLGLSEKPYTLLNEHSTPQDLRELVEECRKKNVALVTDCGTPGFCDPGADLVNLCRMQSIPVTSCPGASSLMTFLSLTGRRLDTFHFEGFLPRETQERQERLKKLLKFKIPVIAMDTPYRMKKLVEEIQTIHPEKKITLGCDLTLPTEMIYIGTVTQVQNKLQHEKAEFLLLLEP